MADSTKLRLCSTILAHVDLVHALPQNTTFLACASLEYGPWLSYSIWVGSRRKRRNVKQRFESEVPLKSLFMYYYLYITLSESTISRQVSGVVPILSLARANRT